MTKGLDIFILLIGLLIFSMFYFFVFVNEDISFLGEEPSL